MQLCDLMEKNVNSCSDKAHKGYRPVGYWAKHSDIDWSTVIYDENLVEFQLLSSAVFKEIYDNSIMPFDGSYPYFTQTSTHGYTLSNDRVKFPLKRFDPANAELIGALAKGTRIVIILEQYIGGSARFCVFGLSGGLRLSEETALDMSGDDKTFEIDLVDVNTNYPNLFLWAGSEAATLLLLESMIGVRVQSIDTPVFEHGMNVGTFDWGSTIEFFPANATDKRLTFEVVDYHVNGEGASSISVDEDGIITVGSQDDYEVAFIRATSVDGGHTTDIVVVNDVNLGAIRFNFGGGDFVASFYTNIFLFKPDGTFVELTSNVAEACPAGVCHLIYENTNTSINISGMPIIGELRTLFNGSFSCQSCTSLTTLSAPSATELYCYYCTSLTMLNAPLSTFLDCDGCALTATSIASILADSVLLPDLSMVEIFLTGGTNAPIGTWSAQAVADKDTIVAGGGTVQYNE